MKKVYILTYTQTCELFLLTSRSAQTPSEKEQRIEHKIRRRTRGLYSGGRYVEWFRTIYLTLKKCCNSAMGVCVLEFWSFFCIINHNCARRNKSIQELGRGTTICVQDFQYFHVLKHHTISWTQPLPSAQLQVPFRLVGSTWQCQHHADSYS